MDEQIAGWAATYMGQGAELLEKQIACYADDNLDWRQVARERVFPVLGERLPAMGLAHAAARERLGFDSDITFRAV